jgi:hypothetical protein
LERKEKNENKDDRNLGEIKRKGVRVVGKKGKKKGGEEGFELE